MPVRVSATREDNVEQVHLTRLKEKSRSHLKKKEERKRKKSALQTHIRKSGCEFFNIYVTACMCFNMLNKLET